MSSSTSELFNQYSKSEVFEAFLVCHACSRYWTDDGKTEDKSQGDKKPRVILITEFMSSGGTQVRGLGVFGHVSGLNFYPCVVVKEALPSGSLKQFLKKTKKNVRKIPLQSWKRWCTQILSALSYLHRCCTSTTCTCTCTFTFTCTCTCTR